MSYVAKLPSKHMETPSISCDFRHRPQGACRVRRIASCFLSLVAIHGAGRGVSYVVVFIGSQPRGYGDSLWTTAREGLHGSRLAPLREGCFLYSEASLSFVYFRVNSTNRCTHLHTQSKFDHTKHTLEGEYSGAFTCRLDSDTSSDSSRRPYRG